MVSDGTNVVMPVAPSGGGFGDGMGSGWWLMFIFFAFILMGWGGNGMGNGNSGEIQRGFDQSSVMTGITTINSGLSDIQQAICAGFSNVNSNISSGFYQAEIAANNRQMASTNQMFNLSQQISNMQSALLAEHCEDRNALNNSTRDIITNMNNGFQSLRDYLCNEKIATLERELAEARSSASQLAQTAQLEAGQRALASEIEQRLNPTPIPAWIVSNPNCCCKCTNSTTSSGSGT